MEPQPCVQPGSSAPDVRGSWRKSVAGGWRSHRKPLAASPVLISLNSSLEFPPDTDDDRHNNPRALIAILTVNLHNWLCESRSHLPPGEIGRDFWLVKHFQVETMTQRNRLVIALPLAAFLAFSAFPAMAKEKGGSPAKSSGPVAAGDKAKDSGSKKDKGSNDLSNALGAFKGIVGGASR
jgi:hypothetical protein